MKAVLTISIALLIVASYALASGKDTAIPQTDANDILCAAIYTLGADQATDPRVTLYRMATASIFEYKSIFVNTDPTWTEAELDAYRDNWDESVMLQIDKLDSPTVLLHLSRCANQAIVYYDELGIGEDHASTN